MKIISITLLAIVKDLRCFQKRNIILLFFTFGNLICFSQTSPSAAYNKVRDLYLSTCPGCKVTPKQCSIFFNRSEKAIEIVDYLIPLSDVTVKYSYIEKSTHTKHFVEFNCRDGNCIYLSKIQENKSGLSVPFLSKQACYDFIDAIANLKEALNL